MHISDAQTSQLSRSTGGYINQVCSIHQHSWVTPIWVQSDIISELISTTLTIDVSQLSHTDYTIMYTVNSNYLQLDQDNEQ